MPIRRSSRHLVRFFVTGVLATLPLAATVAIFWWAASLLLKWLGPDSMIGGWLIFLGLGVSGSEVVGYLIGIGLVACAMVVLGALVHAGVQIGISRLLANLIGRIPLVRTVYELSHRLVDLMRQKDREVLALLSLPEPVLLADRPHLGVIVPTAPVPVGGGLLFVPADWVRPADVGMEALTSIYVSMGVTAREHLPRPH